MNAKQQKCIEIMVLKPELTTEQVAKEVGVSRQSISNWKKNSEFNQALREYFDDQWRDMAKYAQKRMAQLMDSTNDSVALGASKYVMDSYGRGAPIKIESDNRLDIRVVVDD